MPCWDIDIYLEGNRYCTVKLPKLSLTETVTDVIKRICSVKFPVFGNPNGSFTIVNTEKIVLIDMKEVELDEEVICDSHCYDSRPGEYRHADGM